MFGGEEPGEVVIFGLDQLEKLEHDARAPLRIGRGPARKGGLPVRDRLLDLGLARERDLGLHFAGVRIEYVAGPPGRAGNLLAVDEMTDVAHEALSRPPTGGCSCLGRQSGWI